MTDRPIIFSAPMVRALLAGRKTQTRRLASSPLARCAPGDRLYVREQLWVIGDGISFAATELERAYDPTEHHAYHPGRDLWLAKVGDGTRARGVPSIHMPRWASRLTLVVEAVRVEQVQAISEGDARAEGLSRNDKGGSLWKWGIPDRDGWSGTDDDGWPWQEWRTDPREAFAHLWGKLHAREGERWSDNPAVVALTFRVIRGNIDQVPA